MEDITPLKHLDFVLSHSKDERDYADVVRVLLSENSILPVDDEHYLKMILNKLHKDGYIDFLEGQANFKIYIHNREAGNNMYVRTNFQGRLFLIDGGYEGQYNSNKTKETNLASRYERTEKNEENLVTWTENLANRTSELMNWTQWVAFGAIALVVWEIIAFALEHHWFSCS